MSEEIHAFHAREERDHTVGNALFRDPVPKLIEVAHRFGGIRSFGQKSREPFDQRHGRPQPLLLSLTLDLAEAAVRDKKPVPRFLPDASDFDTVNVYAANAERVRDGVKESEGVLRMRVHHSPIRREVVIEANLDVREQAGQWLVHLLDALRQETIQT